MTKANKWMMPLVMLTLALSMTRCNIEEYIPTNIQLVVSPDTLVLSDTSAYRDLYLSTRPKGTIDYILSNHPTWLEPSKTEGTLGKALNPFV